ncbi:MAG TPA: diaminopimelate epimerase [Actinomycetota bacterium]|jgi:diaminopimelate epimerase|nr:diaminopimelate epimerase [Actinomycetota bacterium]
MRFAKYQGTGNDFVMVADPRDALKLSAEAVRRVCDRRFGIGADGVIRVAPGRDGGELLMDYVNSDGSVGEMCGNGIRCLALFAREEGMTSAHELRVETLAGVKTIEVQPTDRVRVDMGPPIFTPRDIPVDLIGDDVLRAHLSTELEVACLSMGNPHAVLFVDDPQEAPVTTLGPTIEHHGAFPNGANVEFVRVLSPERIRMRVWERGSGETLACGTGACAAAVATRLLVGGAERITVELPGGEVEVEWAGSLHQQAPVFLTGDAAKVYDGEIGAEAWA